MDEKIGQHLEAAVQRLDAHCVAAFLAFDGEPDLRPVLQRLTAAGCRIALPVIRDANRRQMAFHYWQPDAPLLRNHYGIEEPAAAAAAPLDDIDLVLMPLAAWDRNGNRLGMGGGYYDRMLAAHRDQARPLRAGVAYSVQCSPQLPGDSWDVPLHAVVSENGWLPLPAPEDDNSHTDTTAGRTGT